MNGSISLLSFSYDVTLGRYYYRESDPEPGMGIYNPVRNNFRQFGGRERE